MLDTTITAIRAREILDSRGRPTVEADVTLANGSTGRGVAPSGASTGANEAHELRDGDLHWYGGRGVGRAVAHVNDEIASALHGHDATDQVRLDGRLRDLDGTPNLRRLGANAILAVSLGACRAAAMALAQPLHERIARLADTRPTLPMPMVNILSGGLHAGRGMDVQDFLAMPVGARDYRSGLHLVAQVRQAAAELLAADGRSTLLADEGGLSPGFADSRQALDLMLKSIERAGLRPGVDIQIALDIAASSLRQNGRYHFARADRTYSSAEMIDLIEGWAREYPIRSVEDLLGEEDWGAWSTATARLGHLQLVGDDLFTTHPERISRGIAQRAANTVLIKFNQNGTLSGTLQAFATARSGAYRAVVSARSGETEDDFMSHLAVGLGAGQIKVGSVRNSERLAKYNTLLRLQDQFDLPYAQTTGLAGTAHA